MDVDESGRLLIVGWDGATFDLIKPYIDQGLMPNTQKLLAQGAHRVLNSTIPTLSPTAWTSFFTGKNPGRHGTFDFVYRRPGTYEILSTRNHLPSLGTLFHWISQSGRQVGTLNVPFTYPPQPVNGFMVSGLGADLNWEFAHPPALRDELLSRDYRIDNPVHYQGDNDEAYLDAALETSRIRAETALELMKSRPWDFFMVVFMNIDQLLSFVWHHMDESHPRHDPELAHLGDKIKELHQYLDQVLGEMMALAGDETTVILASDHGMGPLYKEVFLNNWLREAGYMMDQQPQVAKGTYWHLMRRLGITREGIWRRIGRARTQQMKALLPEVLHWLIPTEHPDLANQIDWSKTKAYGFGNIGQIYVNLAGREPMGIVQPGEEYEALVNEIKEQLYKLADPESGELLVDKVYTKSELYEGPHVDLAPDLNVIMKDYSYITQMRRELAFRDVVRPFLGMSGFHRREGIFAIKGPAIQQGEFEPASILDVTPTALYLMGLEIPDDVDGSVMVDLIEPDFQSQHPIRTVQSTVIAEMGEVLTNEDEEKVQERLRALGYLK
ncbi:MAG: alkaline phosphatase family protein [Chloroflexota bacterium]